jgi:hypothetical protein
VTLRALAGPYFALQGVLVLLWWTSLMVHPPLRDHFQPPGSPPEHLLAFWLPDLALIAAGSLAAAYLRARGGRRLLAVAWIVAGAITYATLYCLALSLATGEAWLSVVLMLPAAVLSILFASALP